MHREAAAGSGGGGGGGVVVEGFYTLLWKSLRTESTLLLCENALCIPKDKKIIIIQIGRGLRPTFVSSTLPGIRALHTVGIGVCEFRL